MMLGLILAAAAVHVGDWVTYRLDGGRGRVAFWRLSVVAEESDAFWLEVELGLHASMKAPLQQTKLLVSRDGAAVKRVLSAFGLERLREVPAPERPAEPAQRPLSSRRGAPARLWTTGGTVTATPIELRAGATLVERFWLSDAVPITRLARVEAPLAGHGLEAVGWGHAAEPRVLPEESRASTLRIEGALEVR